MSILDDAIREHLELKRQHGADESEIKRLEKEAFGPPERPGEADPFAEAPTEFMAQPESPAETPEEGGRRRINIADLQEPPPEPRPGEASEAPATEAAASDAPEIEISAAPEPSEAEAAPIAPAEDPAQAAPPAEEEPPAMEHEVVAEPPTPETELQSEAEAAPPEAAPAPEPEPDDTPSTEERHAIAEQPTEFFDVEAELGTEDAPAPAETPSPSDDEIAAAEQVEPRLVPVADEEDEEDDEFWSDQRLSDELDQALESPLTEEHDVPPPGPEPTTSFFDQEPDAGGEAREEPAEEPHNEYDPDTGHEDVLEDTPEFLEDAPEDDELWFEQRPPKDFDFDD